MRNALSIALLMSLCAVAREAAATCPACGANGAFSQCGKWESIPSCSYPIPVNQNGACPGGTWPAGLHAVHMVLLRAGKVLIWGHTVGGAEAVSKVAHYWDYRTSTQGGQANRTLVPTLLEAECSGTVVKSNGKLLAIGGPITSTGGHAAAYLFDPIKFESSPSDSGWAQTASMQYNRYYPTATVLPDGRILATHGQDSFIPPITFSLRPEVYNGTWTALPASADVSADFQMYPFIQVLPGVSSRVLHAGPGLNYGNLKMQTLDGLDGSAPSWAEVTNHPSTTPGSEVVAYAPGKFLKAGGVNVSASPNATNKAEIVSASGLGVTGVTALSPMHSVRDQQSMVALPSGQVVVIGGMERRVFGSETETSSPVLRTQ